MSERVKLSTLGSGAAEEKFQAAFAAVLENIADVNTPWKAKRKIVLTVTIQPNETRSYGAMDIDTDIKIAKPTPYMSAIAMGLGSEGPVASENDPNQLTLPGVTVRDGKVVTK